MIASVDRGFVLLCNPKTGTTSLEQAFRPFAEISVGGPPKWKHIGYDGLRNMFGNFFEKRDCRIYAVVRDPIDTLESWWRYRSREQLKNPKHRRHRNYTGNISFSRFVEDWASDSPPPHARISTSTDWCLTKKGELAPLVYYRYESLEALVEALSAHVGKRPELPEINVSPRRERDIDREALLRLPRMKQACELYERIPFAA